MELQNLLVVLLVYLTNVQLNVEMAPLTNGELQDEFLNRPLDDLQTLGFTYLGNVGTKQFFVAEDALVSWQDAVAICAESGMTLVRIVNGEENDFVLRQLMIERRGPFWFAARDYGTAAGYRWTNSISPQTVNNAIGTFINFVENVPPGPMALQMNIDLSTGIFGAPSHSKSAKAFCQSGPF